MAAERYQDPATASDQKIVWERALIGFGQSKDKVDNLVKILAADEDHRIGQTRRWQIIGGLMQGLAHNN